MWMSSVIDIEHNAAASALAADASLSGGCDDPLSARNFVEIETMLALASPR
jgi:hypothetical protein